LYVTRELDFGGNNIGDEGIIPIAKALSSNLTLKILNLSANHITDRDSTAMSGTLTPMALLCAALATENNGLIKLDLRGNHIGEKGGENLLDMMKARKSLASSKRAEPLEVEVTERMSAELFEKLMDTNDEMDAISQKNNKKGGGKKGKKK
jgi:Ran GTPase-activating protein (RanGAP) involved in mRNA processing and transport